MYHNSWGGPLEVDSSVNEEDQSTRSMDLDRAALQKLEETQQSWLLGAGDKKKKKKIDLGCIVCSQKVFLGIVYAILATGFVSGLIVLIVKMAPKHHYHPPPPDNYTVALHKALNFFNAQKSGRLPRGNNISYRGNSGLKDGSDVQADLVGGYYDAGDMIKFHFPQAFTMTLLSWSVIEYSGKYEAAKELNHAKELIKWGVDYLLKTFNASAPSVNTIYAQVGSGASTSPDDHFCWTRPEDMDYPRPTASTGTGSDLAAEMAAALAAASIVFKDNATYSHKLVHGAEILFKMSRDRRGRYSASVPAAASFYNSTGYYDEFLWGGSWLYYATGNSSYLQLVTTYGIGMHAGAYQRGLASNVFNWDNKLLGAQLLLTRLRLFQSPGYPYEQVLKAFHGQVDTMMCSFLPEFKLFNSTPGGLVLFNEKRPGPLQNTVNSAFLATLYSDYLAAADVPGWYCGRKFFTSDALRSYAKSQIDYILGKNPHKMSYVVGFGNKYPKHVHHRAASIPRNTKTACDPSGYKWRDSKNPNPNVLEGALMAGPDNRDHFVDARGNYNYTEPTIAGNAGLAFALVALSGKETTGVDATTIFSAIPPLYPSPPPPSPPWNPMLIRRSSYFGCWGSCLIKHWDRLPWPLSPLVRDPRLACLNNFWNSRKLILPSPSASASSSSVSSEPFKPVCSRSSSAVMNPSPSLSNWSNAALVRTCHRSESSSSSCRTCSVAATNSSKSMKPSMLLSMA